MEVFILMQVRRKELTNERRTRAWQNCMVQDKRLELLRRWQRDLNPPCLPIPPILHISYIQPANTAIVVTLKTVSTMLSYTIRLWRFLLARSTFLWSRSISSFLLSRSNLYLHHASPDMKSPRSILAPPYTNHGVQKTDSLPSQSGSSHPKSSCQPLSASFFHLSLVQSQ